MTKTTYRIVFHIDEGVHAWEADFYVSASDQERAVNVAYQDAYSVYHNRVDPYPVHVEQLV